MAAIRLRRARKRRARRALRVTGKKMFVCADGADGFLVSASGRDGPELCYVARNAPGCTLSTTQTVDGRKLATLNLGRAGRSRPVAPIIAECGGRASQSRADGAVVRTARRDGKGAGDHVRLSAHSQAVRQVDRQLPGAAAQGRRYLHPDRGHAIAGVPDRGQQRSLSHRSCVGRRREGQGSEDALFVTQACIQLHGAIGFTDEHDIGLYLKRAMLLSSLLGNAAAQRRRYIAISDLMA